MAAKWKPLGVQRVREVAMLKWKLFSMLSIRDGWDHYLIILACLFSFYVCGRILWEEYGPNFYQKKGDGKKKQNPSDMDKPPGGKLS